MLCRNCIEEDAARAEKAAARKKAKEVFRDMIRQNRGDRIDAPHISEVCATMIRELGGLDQFCAGLVEDYLDARERSPGSATLLKFGVDIFRLARDSSALRSSAPDAVNMTDDELAGEVLALLDQAARKKNIEEAEAGLLELLEEEYTNPDNGRPDEEPSGSAGDGSEDPPAGGAEVLPSD